MMEDIYYYCKYSVTTLLVFPLVFISIVFINMGQEYVLQKKKKLK